MDTIVNFLTQENINYILMGLMLYFLYRILKDLAFIWLYVKILDLKSSGKYNPDNDKLSFEEQTLKRLIDESKKPI